MRLEVLTPTRVMVDTRVDKVVAEAADGSFCLLPRHADWVAALVPAVFSYWAQGREHILAVDEGTLLKCGREVLVSVREAVAGSDLASLRDTVEREFLRVGEHERQARSALARLEAGALRRFSAIHPAPGSPHGA